jgi:hypothetical protein
LPATLPLVKQRAAPRPGRQARAGAALTLASYNIGMIAPGKAGWTMHDALRVVRSELCGRIDRIAAEHGRVSPGRLCAMVDEVRFTAAEFGMQPVVAIARALGSAVASDGHGGLTLAYLDAMRDACGCEGGDTRASTAYLASIGVRMVG